MVHVRSNRAPVDDSIGAQKQLVRYRASSSYDDTKLTQTERDRSGVQTVRELDGLGRTERVARGPDKLQAVETTSYDANGNALSSTDASVNTTSYDYDAANRRAHIFDAAGSTKCYGLARTVLRLIETAPCWPLVECLNDTTNEWIERLRMRAVRGGKTGRIGDWKAAIVTMVLIHQHIRDLDDRSLWPHHLPSVAASEESVKLVEQRLGALDPDYRQFLKHADGW